MIEPVARTVIDARSGWLLWAGGLVGLWTVGSLVETIRDILRRAYGVKFCAPFWEYRLWSILLIIAAVMLLMIAFAARRAIDRGGMASDHDLTGRIVVRGHHDILAGRIDAGLPHGVVIGTDDRGHAHDVHEAPQSFARDGGKCGDHLASTLRAPGGRLRRIRASSCPAHSRRTTA